MLRTLLKMPSRHRFQSAVQERTKTDGDWGLFCLADWNQLSL